MLWAGLALAGGFTFCPALAKEGWVEGEGTAYPKWEYATAARLTPGQFDAFQRFVGAFRAENIELVVALVPPRPLTDPHPPDAKGAPYDRETSEENYRSTLRWLARAGATPVDLLGTALSMAGSSSPFFYPVDDHWSPAGAWATAKEVKRVVAKSSAYKAMPTIRWTTRLLRTDSQVTAVTRRCGEEYGKVEVPVYTTELADSGSTSLLDDVPPPPIVHVGSSMSADHLNFGGFLRQELERDVLSVPVAGGRALSGMATWLASENYRALRPKMVIWEVVLNHIYLPGKGDAPATQDIDYFREITPMVHGDCGAKALLAQSSNPKPGTSEILKVPSSISALGPDAYLVIDGEGSPLGGVEIESRHVDGLDRIILSEYVRVNAVGPRFVELSVERVGRLESVRLRAETPPTAVTVRLCHR